MHDHVFVIGTVRFEVVPSERNPSAFHFSERLRSVPFRSVPFPSEQGLNARGYHARSCFCNCIT